MNVGLGNSRVLGGFSLKEEKGLKHFVTNSHRGKSPSKSLSRRKIKVPTNFGDPIREPKPRSSQELNRKSFEKVNSLRDGDIPKLISLLTSKSEVQEENLSPSNRTNSLDLFESPGGPEKEHLSKRLG